MSLIPKVFQPLQSFKVRKLAQSLGLAMLTALIISCGGGGGNASAPAINLAPVANAGAAQNVVVQSTVLLSAAASSDPEGSALTYAWVFVTTPSGSTATLSGANTVNASFIPNIAGVYTAKVTVTDSQSATSSATVAITVVANTAPVANAGAAQTVYRGNLVSLSGAASSDPDGQALSYAWTLPTRPFGSTAALNNANTVSPSFTPDVVGSYVAQLFVTDILGASSTASSVTITVNNSPGIVNNAFSTACTGTNCSAISPTQYSGAGVGVWRYNNTTANDATIAIDIAGVSAGKKISLVWSNPQTANVASLPASGTDISTDLKPTAIEAKPDVQTIIASAPISTTFAQHQHAIQKDHDIRHERILSLNKAAAERLRSSPRMTSAQVRAKNAEISTKITPRASPLLGATRSWTDYYGSVPVTYPSTNQHVCTLGNGRNAVFWKETANTTLTASVLAKFTTATCGSTGGFSKLINLVGDAWGPHNYSGLITDTASNKQDINIAFVNVPGENWAGYFYGLNNFYTSSAYPSNEALVFFINLANVVGNEDFFISTLIHEARHMINYYQNDIVRGKTTDTWLEETSAMMTEDIISPTILVSGANKITTSTGRLGSFVSSGADVSLDQWAFASNSYAIGGALAAYLNRQYGVALTQGIVTGCTTGTAKTNSIVCLNSQIQALGGVGFSEDFSRMGTSVFSKMAGNTAPNGLGYTAKSTGGYSLAAVDLSAPAYSLATPSTLTAFKSTSHTYNQYTVQSGITRFKRSGVKVPAGTTLQVVIQ